MFDSLVNIRRLILSERIRIERVSNSKRAHGYENGKYSDFQSGKPKLESKVYLLAYFKSSIKCHNSEKMKTPMSWTL
ncbi:unnamed protein product [Blepharisma stoltei]|uniref:Uncharacterized protein n=1 Tax=Blepharisma stoltei TaxID=1481888 RepID=A0AAU9J215_9CILI|nr:unnamed protein product [Blepharisma stoltei]